MLVIEEFIEGAARLRGGAKALDIWRMAPWTDTCVTTNFLGIYGIPEGLLRDLWDLCTWDLWDEHNSLPLTHRPFVPARK